MKPSELICFKDKKFRCVIIFLGHAIKNSSGQMRQISRRIEIIHPIEDWLKTGWARESQTRTRLVDSLICIMCSLENNAFSVLHYVTVALHLYSVLNRFEIFLPLEQSLESIPVFLPVRSESRASHQSGYRRFFSLSRWYKCAHA